MKILPVQWSILPVKVFFYKKMYLLVYSYVCLETILIITSPVIYWVIDMTSYLVDMTSYKNRPAILLSDWIREQKDVCSSNVRRRMR